MIGDKLENFYVTLRVASCAISDLKEGKQLQQTRGIDIQECLYNVAGALYDLEKKECNIEFNETPAILFEIVQDCQKKAAAVLRIVFAAGIDIHDQYSTTLTIFMLVYISIDTNENTLLKRTSKSSAIKPFKRLDPVTTLT